MLPATLLSLVRDHAATQADFASLRLCISGSEKVPSELETEFRGLTGFAINEDYGMTETGFVTVNPPTGVNEAGSVGKPNPGYQLTIRNEAGVEQPHGEAGRLWVRFPAIMTGYWNDPAASGEVIRHGWFDTGNIMKAGADGYLWFCGRKKQIIVHDGSNIYPQEVEDALLEHPAVSEAGVVGVHNLLHGENVRAYITLKPGIRRPPAHDLIHYVRQRIGYRAPEEIVVLGMMPLNPTGKVNRAAL